MFCHLLSATAHLAQHSQDTMVVTVCRAIGRLCIPTSRSVGTTLSPASEPVAQYFTVYGSMIATSLSGAAFISKAIARSREPVWSTCSKSRADDGHVLFRTVSPVICLIQRENNNDL